MNIKDLLEMAPVYDPSEAKFGGMMQQFYSNDTIERDFEFANKFEIDGQDVFVVIAKDRSKAAIGSPGVRKTDKKAGMNIVGIADFRKPDISSSKWFNFNQNVLQIDSVEVHKKFKTLGYGFHLYLGLVKAGFVIISDNYQYVGGKSLWKKIATQDKANEYKVYVIDNGQPICDDEGNPLEYNGTNIDDADIWSENSDEKHFVVLAMKSIKK